MKVILLERVENLGPMGHLVTVKDGYARNYLLPFKKALRATKENIDYFEQRKEQLEAQNLKIKQDAEIVAKKMGIIKVIIIRQASEVGHLYGSVRAQDIAEKIVAQGYTVNRGQIVIKTPIKTLGTHVVKIVLHPEVSIEAEVLVALSEEEAMAGHNDVIEENAEDIVTA